jgi:transposase
MIGIQKKQEGLFCYGVHLEKRVPRNHPLRKLKQVLDLSFVRPAVSQFYGYNGNESVDPEVIVKLMILLFLDDISSERELLRMLPYRLDYLWFLDYGLDSEIPDHSVLSKARRRWGMELFEKLFVQSVKQCWDAGLVEGKKIYVDGSLVDANASCDSVRRGSRELLGALSAAYRREERKLESIGEEPTVGGDPGPSGSEDPPKNESGYSPVNNNLLCVTDPDAAVVRHGSLASRPRYKSHRAVDDECGVITAVETTSGDVSENHKLFDLIAESERNTEVGVEVVVGDCQYGTVDNFRRCLELGIKPHMGDFAANARQGHKRKGEIYGEEKFIYDSSRDVYVCPAGNFLKRRHHKPWRRAYYYGCSPRLCGACSQQSQCTRGRTGRTVIRHEGQELVDAARAVSRSYAARLDRQRRKHKMEGSFADAANNHGFKRSRWRGLRWQKVQDWLIAFCQNIRILVSNFGPDRARAEKQAVNPGLLAFLERTWEKIAGIFAAKSCIGPIFGI